MSSEVDIANRALAQSGARSKIASLSEASREAEACTMLLASTRDMALQLAPWDFARGAVTLGLLKARPGTPENPTVPTSTNWDSTTTPLPPWTYEYAVPSDSIFMRWVLGQRGDRTPTGPERFVRASDIGGGGGRVQVVLTHAPSAIGIYTVRMTDPNTWPPTFQECVVQALAARLSIPLSGDKNLATGNLNAANMALVSARVTDGNESFNHQIDVLPDWIKARDSWPGPWEPPDPLVFTGLFQLS